MNSYTVRTTTGRQVRIVSHENGGPLGTILVDSDGGKWRSIRSALQVAPVAPAPEEEPTAAPETEETEETSEETPDADAAAEGGSDTVEETPETEE